METFFEKHIKTRTDAWELDIREKAWQGLQRTSDRMFDPAFFAF